MTIDGQLIRQAREKMNLTLEEASKKIRETYHVRLSESYLSQIETGSKTNLTTNLVNALFDFFKLTEYDPGAIETSANHEIKKSPDDINNTTPKYPTPDDVPDELAEKVAFIQRGMGKMTEEQRKQFIRMAKAFIQSVENGDEDNW